MNRKIKLLIIVLLVVLTVITEGCEKSGNINSIDKRNLKIGLILKMNTGYHWGTIKLGADTAAREFNVTLDYNAPYDEEDVEGQIRLVRQAFENKVDALILSASDFKGLVEVTEEAYDRHIPVIIIDSEVDTNKITSFVATDNIYAGKKAGAALLEKVGGNCRIAVMSFVKGTGNADQREKGLLDVLSQYPDVKILTKEYCLSDTKLAYQYTKNIIAKYGKVDAIIALNAISTEGVAEAVDEMGYGGTVKIIGFDSTSREIDYMDKGVIQALVIQNPFSMGYLGVKYAVDAIESKKIPKVKYTESKVIDAQNMYLPENQKLIFPLMK